MGGMVGAGRRGRWMRYPSATVADLCPSSPNMRSCRACLPTPSLLTAQPPPPVPSRQAGPLAGRAGGSLSCCPPAGRAHACTAPPPPRLPPERRLPRLPPSQQPLARRAWRPAGAFEGGKAGGLHTCRQMPCWDGCQAGASCQGGNCLHRPSRSTHQLSTLLHCCICPAAGCPTPPPPPPASPASRGSSCSKSPPCTSPAGRAGGHADSR